MSKNDVRPDLKVELSRLKDFQLRTVDRVFQRLYLDEHPTRRFLVADEVGLGKTLVARGVILKTIDHLWDKVGRIDIIYLCSNSDIARQNVARLTPGGLESVQQSPRITLLPLATHQMGKNKVNVIPLTPGTSLKVAGSLGLKTERALLCHILEKAWELDELGARRFFAAGVQFQPFKQFVRDFSSWYTVDEELTAAFLAHLDRACTAGRDRGEQTIRQRLATLAESYHADRARTPAEKTVQRKLIGELRQLLGQACIRSLEPDLIILDEFQRFKDLLGGESPEAEMARQLFEYEDEQNNRARVLLLSATPYKMYTTPDEANGESHYEDFVRTAKFLFHDEPERANTLAHLLKEYRRELFRGAGERFGRLEEIRAGLEETLRSGMVRTERLAVTPDRSGMLTERPISGMTIEPRDIRSFAEGQRLARLAKHPDILEYWKAAPWLLNFMDEYKYFTKFHDLLDEDAGESMLLSLVEASPNALLDCQHVDSLAELDPAHGRLRWLISHTLDAGLWSLLWLPPTLGYYRLGDAFERIAKTSLSKTLIFSAWRVVPRVIAAVLSHNAERRVFAAAEGGGDNLTGIQDRLGDLLRVARRDGAVAGMTTLAILYPCGWMAAECDPMALGSALQKEGSEPPTLEAVLAEAERRIAPTLERVTRGAPSRTAPDESWYWAAPLLIDLDTDADATVSWLESDLAESWGGGGKKRRATIHLEQDEDEPTVTGGAVVEDASALDDLVERLRLVATGERPRGAPPKDLARMLALMAIAGPATVALRMLGRIGGLDVHASVTRSAAARMGAGFRTLFNQPDATAAVRVQVRDGDYWKQCLEYSAALGIQPMLDEYGHLLMSEEGLHGKNPAEVATRLADRVSAVVGIRRANVGVRDIHVKRGTVRSEKRRMRSRFAMRFGEERKDESDQNLRADDVRNSFNSPFAPFVLATTSVGQEGLDFHFYCHSVVHWNLPPNPVDLEQREGRVHRFKGLAIRKNVAQAHGNAWKGALGDPWEATFDEAVRDRDQSENDLVPFWVFPVDGGARIERHVPSYVLSREIERFAALRESLAIYRMVFGQPRQDELMAYLARMVPVERIPELAARLQISLAP